MREQSDRDPLYLFASVAFRMILDHARFGAGPGGDISLELAALLKGFEDAEQAIVEDGIPGSEAIEAAKGFLCNLAQVARGVLDREPRDED